MNHRYVFGLFLTALSLVSSVPRVHAASPGILLSEIAWAGSSKSTADEWIELSNVGSGSASLAGWKLTGVGTSGDTLTLPDGATIAAGSTYLVANYNVGGSSTLLTTPDYVTTAVSISNTALNVSLLDQTGAIVESLVDPGTPNAGSSTTFSSMERASDGTWVTAEVSTNLLNGQLGSPGVAGHITVPVVETAPVATVETTSMTVETIPITATPSAPLSSPSSGSSDPMSGGDNTAPAAAATSEPASTQVVTISDPASTPSQTIETTVVVESPPAEPTISNPVIVESLIEPTIEPVAEPEPTTSDEQRTTSGSLIISAFLAAPNTGEDEWIEVTNTGITDIDVSTYTIVDATGKATALSGVIAAGSTVVITNPKSALNNDGDTIAILDSSGSTVDEVAYGTADLKAPKKNAVLRYERGAWTSEESVEISDTASTDVTAAEVVATDIIPTETASIEIESTETVSEPVVAEAIEAASEDTPSTSDATLSTTSNSQRTTTIILSPGDLVISAIFPAPATGDDEWIAVTNTTDAAIDLSSMSIADASGAETALSGSVSAGATVYVTNPKGKLNNDGDTISLLNSGSALDVVTYGTDELPAPKKGETLIFDGYAASSSSTFSPTLTYETTIMETSPAADPAPTAVAIASSSHATPRANAVVAASTTNTSAHSISTTAPRVSTAPTTTTRSSTRKTSSTKTNAIKNVSIDDIDQLADDTNVSLEGIVVAIPGSIGKRSFFLDGLEVYQNQGDLADVAIGDRVRITGTASVLSDHRRVNIKVGAVSVLGTATPVLHDYGEGLRYGSLTRAVGTVSARSGNDVILSLDDGSLLTLSTATGVSVNWSDLAGKHVAVAGILKTTAKKTALVIRNAEDILVDASTTENAATLAGTTSSSFPWLETSFAVFTAAGIGFWFWKTRPISTKILTPLHSSL